VFIKSGSDETFWMMWNRKLRFETDEYKLGSCGFIVLFLSRGQTTAFLQHCGNVTCWKDELQMAAMTGAKMLLARFASHVGSAWHCLAGDCC